MMAKTGIELKGLNELIERLDEIGVEIKPVLTNALEQMAETVEFDTEEAIQKANLPAKGKYSRGVTKKTIIRNSEAVWEGTRCSIGLGFDRTKPGNGSRLITGTPKMKPDIQLQKIYGGWGRAHSQYQKELMADVEEVFMDFLQRKV